MFAKIPNSQCFSVQRVVVVRPSLLGARGTLLAQIPTGKLPIRSLSFFFFYHWWDPASCRHGVRGTLLAQWELAHPFASLVVAHPFVLWATCHRLPVARFRQILSWQAMHGNLPTRLLSIVFYIDVAIHTDISSRIFLLVSEACCQSIFIMVLMIVESDGR